MVLKKRDALQMVIRSLMLQTLLNHRTMQGGGYLFALWPWLKKTKPLPERVEACSDYLNAHPVFGCLAIGALRKRVEEYAVESDPEDFPRWRESMCGPLGMMGDALIWDRWKPIVFAFAALCLLIWPKISVWIGVSISALLLYNIPVFYLRWWGIREGYRLGERVLEALGNPIFSKIRRVLTIVGAILAGAIVGAVPINFCYDTEASYTAMYHLSYSSFIWFTPAFILTFIGCRRQWPVTSTLLLAILISGLLVYILGPVAAYFRTG